MIRATSVRHFAPLLAAVLASSAGISPADAHHSIAMFDGRRVVRITGTVTAFRWINPHASIQLDVQGDADAEVQAGPWTVEMQAPSTLMTDGWSRESLTAGDRITLFVNLQRGAVASSSPQRGLYVGAVLADGTSLGQAGPR